ncbi:hypothetical protein FE782_00765 [Paenibacillus antri]|uniref:Glycoside hydrolase family 38 central domain-containing protein n=1 Tax=Paenibacillus antri TaxID=2582848 RepID=A0A5R9GI29_9BACL|nr:glycosyl hydrolase-related protein [Paenibacillus antri]TLS53920.1 hypothetical protein FE782_00765 [Paenibacillus antri]
MKPRKTYHFISHTHWDREWYLTFEQFRYRLAHLIDNLLDLLDRESDFKYFHLDGQTIVLEDYYALRPERRERLEQYIRSGRILVGPWYQQNDLFLTSGESTVRNLMEGIRTSRALGGEMKVGYLPDHFGLAGQMPQLFRQAGIDNCIFGRGLDIESHESPFVKWRSPDGSEVAGMLLYYWYNSAQRLPNDEAILRLVFEGLREREEKINPSGHYAMMNGVDHLEAQYDLPEVLEKLRKMYGEEAEFVHDTLPNYAAAVKAYMESLPPEQVEVVHGELRECFEYSILAGTLSSRVYLKQANLRCHDLLEKWVEPLSAWTELLDLDEYDAGAIDYLWRAYMECHPHDSICGCSQDAVHDHMMDRFRRVEELSGEVLDRKLNILSSAVSAEGCDAADHLLFVMNTSQLASGGTIRTNVDFLAEDEVSTFAIEDPDGREVPYRIVSAERLRRQVLSPINLPGVIDVHRYVVEWKPCVPALGYAAYRLRPNATGRVVIDRPLPARPTLENERLLVEVRPDGTFDVTEKSTGAVLRGQGRFQDAGDRGDLYVFGQVPGESALVWSGPVEYMRRTKNELYEECVYRFDWALPVSLSPDLESRSAGRVVCSFEVTLRLDRDASEISMRIDVCNRAKDHRIRVLFPTNGTSEVVLAGGQFDVAERAWNEGAGWKRDANSQPFWKWFATSANGIGTAVFAKGLHEYEMIDVGTVASVTLLRCVETIHLREPIPMQEDRQPKGQCLGSWTFELAVRPFVPGEVAPATLYREAERFHQGLMTKQRPIAESRWKRGRPWVQDGMNGGVFPDRDPNAGKPRLARRGSFMRLEGDALLSAVKRAADGRDVVVRMYNVGRRETDVTIGFPVPTTGMSECNFLEEPYEGAKATETATIGAKKIVTFRVAKR